MTVPTQAYLSKLYHRFPGLTIEDLHFTWISSRLLFSVLCLLYSTRAWTKRNAVMGKDASDLYNPGNQYMYLNSSASLHAPCSRSYIASTIGTPQPIISRSRSAPFHHVARYFPVWIKYVQDETYASLSAGVSKPRFRSWNAVNITQIRCLGCM